MNVAFAMMNMEPRGAEHDVLNLATGLRKHGHCPLVITSGGELIDELRSEGVPVVLCPIDVRALFRLWVNGKRIANILEEHGADVFNPQGVYPAVSGYWATRTLLKRGKKVPNVATIPMFNRLSPWYYRLGSFVLNLVADHVIVESQCEYDRLRRSGMKRPMTILHNCAPAPSPAACAAPRDEIRSKMGWPQDRTVFLMPARMSVEKGHDILLRALAEPAMRNLPVLCYLAGDGPRLSAMQDLARQLGVSDRVIFGGHRRDLAELYRAADVFVLSSRYESLPLSIREGMLAALPVIAPDVGGVAEAVEDGATGILFPMGDSPALAAAMARLAGDAELRAVMGRRGRELAARKFDPDQWVQRTVELMESVKSSFARTCL